MTQKKKVILSISSILLVLILYGWGFGLQTVCMIGTRHVLQDPVFNLIPEPMYVGPGADPVKFIKAYDYSFSILWIDFSQNGSRTSLVGWATSNTNASIVCFAPEEGLYSAWLHPEDRGEDSQGYRELIGALDLEGITQTNRYVYTKMWNVTPRDLSFLRPRFELMRNLQTLWLCRSSYQVLVIGCQDKPYAISDLAQ